MFKITPDENGKYPSKYLPTRLMLAMRIIVGIYLFYLVYQMRDSFTDPANNLLVFIAAIVFTIAAIIIIVTSVMALMHGRFQGGELDADVLADDAVKNIEGLDDPARSVSNAEPAEQITDAVSGSDDGAVAGTSSDEPVDEFDPHHVVYKKKKQDQSH